MGLAGRPGSWTLAVFHNEVDNGLVQSGPGDLNPNGNRYYVAAGTRRATRRRADDRPAAAPELAAQRLR